MTNVLCLSLTPFTHPHCPRILNQSSQSTLAGMNTFSCRHVLAREAPMSHQLVQHTICRGVPILAKGGERGVLTPSMPLGALQSKRQLPNIRRRVLNVHDPSHPRQLSCQWTLVFVDACKMSTLV